MKKCPHCGTNVSDEANFCISCGHSLTASEKGAEHITDSKPKGSGCSWALSAIIVIGVIIGIGKFVSSVVEQTWNESDGRAKTTASASLEVAQIGDRLSVGEIDYTVNGVSTAITIGSDPVSYDAKGMYLIVDMTITNQSDDPITISSSFFKIIYAGREYAADNAATMFVDSGNSLWYDELNPGLSTSGSVVFDVTDIVARSDVTRLQVQTGFWGTQTGLISLKR